MIIIALLYIALVWLIFFRFRLLRFNWPWRIVTVVLGVAILAVFLGLLSYLTPTGRIVVAGRVVEVTPNVAGTVTALPISPNTLVEAGTVLFQIDPTPYQTKVKQLAAALAEAVQKVDQLKASLDRASADVANLDFQLGYSRQRFADTERLARTSAVSEFSRQDAAVKVQSLVAQVEAAKANQRSARSAVESQIDGENTMVAQLSAQLEGAQWELDQTTVRAPDKGYVGIMLLTVGTRVVPLRSALSFILADEIGVYGIFPQNGFGTVAPGVPVKLAFANRPGRLYDAKVSDVFRGIGEGQLAVSGVLPRPAQVGSSLDFPVRITIPEDMDASTLRLGMVGIVTAYSANAGPISLLADILLWVKAYALYL